MNASPQLTWAALAGMLITTASRDLAAIDGAFGLAASEWTVITFAGGVLAMLAGAIVAMKTTENQK